MKGGWLDSVLGRRSGSFTRSARARGLRRRAAETLEGAALAVAPEDPTSIFDSRELFEVAATNAVVRDEGNLELSFSLVDELANVVEALGLARSSDVPDPFRRVWVKNGAGQKIRGVVLTCRAGEVAVFCPPSNLSIAEIGAHLWLRYRGFTSSVEYELQLDDAVRLPGALVLHFKRPSGGGAIGRSSVRHPVDLDSSVRVLDDDSQDATGWLSGKLTDISSGGVAFEAVAVPDQGARARVQFALPDGSNPFVAEVVVRWARPGSAGKNLAGLEFVGLPRPRAERLDRYLQILANPEFARPSTVEVKSPPITRSAPAPRSVARSIPQQAPSPGRIATKSEQMLVECVFFSVARSVSVVNGQALRYAQVRAESEGTSAVPDVARVLFPFSLESRAGASQGYVYLPLNDALVLSAMYLMMSEDEIHAALARRAPDSKLSAAMAQIGELVAYAVERAYLRATGAPVLAQAREHRVMASGDRAEFEGLDFGARLSGRCSAELLGFEPFELHVSLPNPDTD